MNKAVVESVFHTINECWPFARLDPFNEATAEVWWNALSDLPTSAVGEATIRLARSEEKRHPTPGQFRRLVALVLEDRVRKAQYVETKRAEENIRQRSPKENAWAATQAAFARRILGPGEPVPESVFETDFDVEYVCGSVTLPGSSRFEDHENAFADLKVAFEQEWGRRHGSVPASPAEEFV